MKKLIITILLLLMTFPSIARVKQDYLLATSIANSRNMLDQRMNLDKKRVGLLTGCALIAQKKWICESQHILQDGTKDLTIRSTTSAPQKTQTSMLKESSHISKDIQKGLSINKDKAGIISASFSYQQPATGNLTIYEMQAPTFAICKTTLPASFTMKTMGTESCFLEIQLFN